MRFGKSVLAATLAIGLSLATSGAFAASGAHWGYEGDHGPEHWGHMKSEYKACAEGKTQSPIDLTGAVAAELGDIKFDYNASKLNVLNNGHTVQVNYDGGSSITVDGEQYNLLQFHFHTPSEHTVAGKSFGNEMHLVHKNDKGELAVVGVLIEKGAENAAYKAIWSNLPKKADEKKSVAVDINASELLPKEKDYFTYSGSLTTPPCSENVRWIVLQSPIQMSEAQIKEIQKIMHKNNRPVQKMHDRTLKSSK